MKMRTADSVRERNNMWVSMLKHISEHFYLERWDEEDPFNSPATQLVWQLYSSRA
jgi:hypothetical protein